MKQGLQVVEPVDGQASPALHLERDLQVDKASQEKEGLQDRGLANVVCSEQDVEAAELVEIEIRQAPEPTDLDAVQMLVIRHAYPRLRRGDTGAGRPGLAAKPGRPHRAVCAR